MNGKQTMGLHTPLNPAGPLPGRYSPPYRGGEPMRRMPNPPGSLFGPPGIDDSLLARDMDMSKGGPVPLVKPDTFYGHNPDMNRHHMHHNPHMPTSNGPMGMGFGPTPGDTMLDQISAAASMPGLSGAGLAGSDHTGITSHAQHHQMYSPVYTHTPNGMNSHPSLPAHPNMHPHSMHHDLECDPRELEAFAERFKQRRIKLGVTQADVGRALGKLKLPGVGSLSQSTICRFESLTLSHNNMIALKPILQAWLEEAERAAREIKESDMLNGMNDKKRKRTSIAAPEKRSLEAYFAVQPRPSGEKIAQIAEKLDLKKNVVRVWFCNQRQKQKRLKFSAGMCP